MSTCYEEDGPLDQAALARGECSQQHDRVEHQNADYPSFLRVSHVRLAANDALKQPTRRLRAKIPPRISHPPVYRMNESLHDVKEGLRFLEVLPLAFKVPARWSYGRVMSTEAPDRPELALLAGKTYLNTSSSGPVSSSILCTG